MRRTAALLFVLALVASGCGGGDDSGTGTSASPEPTTAGAESGDGAADQTTTAVPTTANVGDGSTTEFCAFIADLDESTEADTFDPDTFRESVEASVDALDRARELAPAEIRDDVEIVAGAFEGFAELLEEYDYDLMALAVVAADDERVLALEEDELIAASQRIGAFCGIDLDAGVGVGGDDPGDGGDPGDSGDPGDQGSGIDSLAPPGLTDTRNMGGTSTGFSSDASFQEVVDFYTDVLGPALFVNQDEEAAVWNTDFEGDTVAVAVSGQDGRVEVLVTFMP